VFRFNEGSSVFGDRFLDEEDLSSFSFMIHPVFWDYLRLDTSHVGRVLDFDWGYLHRSEAALAARL
jgi:hypothetical protein